MNSLVLKQRQFVNRVINFLRPQPRFKPLSVEEVLKNSNSMDVVNKFNDFYYTSGVCETINWQGISMIKNPCDLWMSILLFQKIRPTVIIETGTHHGGSATYYADMLKSLGIKCDVITIDINPKWSYDPRTKNIHSVIGYSTEPQIVAQVRELVAKLQAQNPGPVMLYLDSNHSKENVLNELELYSDLVTKGSYAIVEDTNVNGHPSGLDHGPGPYEAVDEFLKTHKEFVRDPSCQQFLLTFNPDGWLLKK